MAAPPRSVLAAFGADGPLTPLTGGQGASWRAGTVVLKPLDRRPEELAYEARLLARLREGDAIRLARPLRAADGRWVVDGWCATTTLDHCARSCL